MENKTAILIDGGFFLKRLHVLYGKKIATDAGLASKTMHQIACDHLPKNINKQQIDKTSGLYRIFFYDCPPLTKRVHYPISGKSLDFSKSDTAIFRQSFHKEIIKMRKVALRLGFLDERNAHWQLKLSAQKLLLSGKLEVDKLLDSHFGYSVRQKQIDMKIGLDISALSERGKVKQIVLISGDSDFVPAAKTARRAGVDFILDPMWANIKPDLHEHIDGLRSTSPKVKSRKN